MVKHRNVYMNDLLRMWNKYGAMLDKIVFWLAVKILQMLLPLDDRDLQKVNGGITFKRFSESMLRQMLEVIH